MLLAAIAILFKKPAGEIPVVAGRLMTDREREVLPMIEAQFPGCTVHARVSLGALLNPKPGLDRKVSTSVRNRFNQKIADYVIEDRASGNVLAIVELDDRTHSSSKDKQRDRMTSAAGYQTVRLPAARITPDLVREKLSGFQAMATVR